MYSMFINLLDKLFKNLKYIFYDCQLKRGDRLPACCFWWRVEGELNPEKIYNQFKEEFSEGKHKHWCLYFSYWYKEETNLCDKTCPKKYYSEEDKIKWRNIREGVKYLGIALHHECHDPYELTQYRIMGAKIKEYVFNWDNIFENGKDNDKLKEFLMKRLGIDLGKVMKITKTDNCIKINDSYSLRLDEETTKAILKKGDMEIHEFIVKRENDQLNIYNKKENDDVELFRRHYHELGCLKAALISEINKKDNENSTIRNFLLFFGSVLLAGAIAVTRSYPLSGDPFRVIGLYIIVFSFVNILFLVFWYLHNYISLNEAKDALYICLGIDIDKRKETGKEFMTKDVAERPC